jgi:hypothetical protein
MRGNRIDSAVNFFDIAKMLNARSDERKCESMHGEADEVGWVRFRASD